MAFKLLANITSRYATDIDTLGDAATDTTGYPLTDGRHMATGPRSEIVQFNPTTNNGAGIMFDFVGTQQTVDYLVVTRADWPINSGQAIQYQTQAYDSGGTPQVNTAWQFFFSAFEPLKGPRGQDGIIPFTPNVGEDYGYGIQFRREDLAAICRVSDVCFCRSTDIGYPTKATPPASEVLIGDDQTILPIQGHFPYWTEKRITTTWLALSTSELEDFETFLDEGDVLREPCFLYDDTSALWDYELEHVLLETYEVQALPTFDRYSLTVTWRRLKHYL